MFALTCKVLIKWTLKVHTKFIIFFIPVILVFTQSHVSSLLWNSLLHVWCLVWPVWWNLTPSVMLTVNAMLRQGARPFSGKQFRETFGVVKHKELQPAFVRLHLQFRLFKRPRFLSKSSDPLNISQPVPLVRCTVRWSLKWTPNATVQKLACLLFTWDSAAG